MVSRQGAVKTGLIEIFVPRPAFIGGTGGDDYINVMHTEERSLSMQFKTIIAAIDLDDDLAEEVLKTAHSLAQKDGARLRAVTVWPSVTITAPAFSGEVAATAATVTQSVIEQHREGRERCKEHLTARAAKFAPGAEAVVLEGDAADEAATYAEEIGADLIVTGSHQRNFWNSLLQGSASRELVREAPCAVFIVTKACASKS